MSYMGATKWMAMRRIAADPFKVICGPLLVTNRVLRSHRCGRPGQQRQSKGKQQWQQQQPSTWFPSKKKQGGQRERQNEKKARKPAK
eukprot:3062134-Amphidinium_carterae.2